MHAAFRFSHVLRAMLSRSASKMASRPRGQGAKKSGIRIKREFLKRFYGDKNDHSHQDEYRDFIEPAVKNMAAGIPVGGELFDQFAAIIVIDDQHQHQQKFGVHPFSGNAITQPNQIPKPNASQAIGVTKRYSLPSISFSRAISAGSVAIA